MDHKRNETSPIRDEKELIFEKCYFCEEELKKESSLTITKLESHKHEKIISVTCLTCVESESFTMADLSKMLAIPVSKLKGFLYLKQSQWHIAKGSDGKGVKLGLSDRIMCGICNQLIRQDETLEMHVEELHCDEQTAKCTSGCGLHFLQTDVEHHETMCGLWCDKCERDYPAHSGHFLHVHPGVVCPFVGCCLSFQLTSEQPNPLLGHILSHHLWQTQPG